MTGTTDAIENVLMDARSEGVGLWSDGRSIHYRSPNPLSEPLRDLILANKGALLAHLAAWDLAEAIRLGHAADGVVAESGVSGTDPEIAEIAERGVRAHLAHDMTGVRSACALIENRVRKLTARRTAA